MAPVSSAKNAASELTRADRILVPSIVLWEILFIEGKGRIRFDRPPVQWLREALGRPRVELAELTAEIAAQAVAYGRAGPGDPADKIIAATARVLGVPLVTRDERIASLLAFVDLAEWKDAVMTKLSGGMKHRTSLAAALLPKPRLLVLDEPTVGVDPELRSSFWSHFAKLRQEGTTILLTTHYMDEARRCERVGLLRRGKLIAEGAPVDILRESGTDNLEDAFLKLAGRGAGP